MASWISDQSRIISFDILESRKSQVLVYVYVYTFKYLKIVSKVCWSFLFYSRVVLLCGLINNRLMPPGGHKKKQQNTHFVTAFLRGPRPKGGISAHVRWWQPPHFLSKRLSIIVQKSDASIGRLLPAVSEDVLPWSQ